MKARMIQRKSRAEQQLSSKSAGLKPALFSVPKERAADAIAALGNSVPGGFGCSLTSSRSVADGGCAYARPLLAKSNAPIISHNNAKNDRRMG